VEGLPLMQLLCLVWRGKPVLNKYCQSTYEIYSSVDNRHHLADFHRVRFLEWSGSFGSSGTSETWRP
jgi:hypothetical protein